MLVEQVSKDYEDEITYNDSDLDEEVVGYIDDAGSESDDDAQLYQEDLSDADFVGIEKSSTIYWMLHEAGKYPLLTAEQELELGKKVKEGTAEERSQAIDTFILHNMRLAINIAKRLRSDILMLEDRIQIGFLGLHRAAEKYDYTKGRRFSTYATPWVRQFISREILNQDTIRVPVHSNVWYYDYVKFVRQHNHDYYCDPTEQEVMEWCDMKGIPYKRLNDIRTIKNLGSLNAPVGEEEHGEVSELGDFVASPQPLVEEEVNSNELHDAIYESMRLLLNDRAIFILEQRWGLTGEDPKTLEEVGQILGLTRERVRQIQEKAEGKLRRSARTKYKLQEFLAKQ